LVLVGGTYAAFTAPVDVFPDLTAPTVTVLAEAHGMAPEEVELLVTFPVETAVNGAAGVRRVRSSSSQGISIVWVEFDWGTDIFRARQIVNEKLQMAQAQLPEGIDPPILAPVTSIMGEILLLGLTSESHSSLDLRSAADWTVRKRLLAIPGVAQVVPIGGEVKEYQVRVDPKRLRGFGISLAAVLRAAGEANAVASGGVFSSSGSEVVIRGLGRVRTLDDLAHTVVEVRDGRPILLRDVAEVVVGPRPTIGAGAINGQPAVVLAIQKQPAANTLELTRRIDAELERLQAQLPEGMIIDREIFRQADFIRVAIDNVLAALRDGAILVVLILFLFLWNLRTTAISVLAIPLSLVVAVLSLRVVGITVNTMTLGGMAIAIGALVDDAIIAVENMYRRLGERASLPPEERPPADAVVLGAAREVLSPIVNATLIITIVFVPLFFLSGVEGRMLRPLGLAYIVSIGASLLVAVTVTPALASYLLAGKRPVTGATGWLATRLIEGYQRILLLVVDRPGAVSSAVGVVVLLTLAVLPALGRGFLPEFQEGTLTVSAVTVPGTSIAESDAIGRLVEERMLAHPQVISTARRTGRAELDEHAQGTNAAEIDVVLDLSSRHLEPVVEEIREDLALVPGVNITIGQPIGHRIDHMLSGTRAGIAIKIFGPDLQELRRLGNAVRDAVADVPGLADLSVEQQADVPQVQIHANRAAMAQFGVTPGHLAEAVDVAFYGEPVAQVLEGQEAYDVVVRYREDARGSIEAIRDALVDVGVGGTVPMSSIADVREERGPNTISRENVQRKLVVQANAAGRDVGSVVDDVEAAIAASVPLPEGYYVEFGGQFESGRRAARAVGALSLLSIAAIFLILFQEFGTLRPTILVMLNLPLALIGGVFATLMSSGVLNVATLVGFVTLFGIAVRNGILLVSNYQRLLGEGVPLREAVLRGSVERLNPILMTALTAALALVPLALGGGEPGKEIQAPMALVVLGGLLTSTLLNMIVVPTLFLRVGVGRRSDA
jgi:CzcA family heavy metal efflux pump